jgi:hypothetical protein
LRDRWSGLIAASSPNAKNVELDAPTWLARATLDIMGLAGFGYSFSSLSGSSNELHDAFKTILGGQPNGGNGLMMALSMVVPGFRYLVSGSK